jgi:hypothetical protein
VYAGSFDPPTHGHLDIIARARDTTNAGQLYRAGASHAVPETLESSLQLSEAVLVDLGLDDAACRQVGIRLHKVGVVWPLEAQLTREFATGLQEILVV